MEQRAQQDTTKFKFGEHVRLALSQAVPSETAHIDIQCRLGQGVLPVLTPARVFGVSAHILVHPTAAKKPWYALLVQ